VVLVRLIISRLFHVAPIPATQNAAPTRKPLRVFSFWKPRTGGFKVFACAIVLSFSGQLAAGEFVRGVLSVSAVQMLAEADEKYGQGQQQNTQIEQGHDLLAVSLVETEGIWLWARVWTLCSPVGVGNLLTTKNPIGTWTYSYDAADRLKTVLTPEMHTTTYSYDKNSNRTVAKNANLHALTMAYNARNQLESLIYPNSEAESYRYDPNDNRIGRTDANGTVHTMMFDAWNRLKSQSAPTAILTQAASSVLTYDGNNNLLSTVTNRTYDQAARLASITVSEGVVTVSRGDSALLNLGVDQIAR